MKKRLLVLAAAIVLIALLVVLATLPRAHAGFQIDRSPDAPPTWVQTSSCC